MVLKVLSIPAKEPNVTDKELVINGKFVISLIEVKLGKRNLSLHLRVEQAVRPIVRGYHAYLPRELAVDKLSVYAA